MTESFWGRFERVTKDVFSYSLKPKYHIYEESLLRNLPDFLVLVLADFMFSFLAGIPLIFMAGEQGLPFENVFESINFPLWVMLLFGAVIAPLMEEATFRAPMRPTAIMLALAGGMWLTTLLDFVVPAGFVAMMPGGVSGYLILSLTLALGFGVWFYRYLTTSARLQAAQNIIARHFAVFYWGITAVFALLHLGNYPGFNPLIHFTWIPFLVAPQFMAGLFLGYARMRFGLWAAILSHAMGNAVLIFLAYGIG